MVERNDGACAKNSFRSCLRPLAPAQLASRVTSQSKSSRSFTGTRSSSTSTYLATILPCPALPMQQPRCPEPWAANPDTVPASETWGPDLLSSFFGLLFQSSLFISERCLPTFRAKDESSEDELEDEDDGDDREGDPFSSSCEEILLPSSLSSFCPGGPGGSNVVGLGNGGACGCSLSPPCVLLLQ